MLTDKKSGKSESSAAGRITQDQNELLSYASALANNEGGELYYGIDSHGTVWGERLNQVDGIRREVEKEIAKILWPKHVEILHEFCKIFFLPVRHHDAHPRYVIKIRVDPCPGGVFIQEPESYYVVSNSVVKLPFPNWIACLEGSTVEIPDKTTFGERQGKININ